MIERVEERSAEGHRRQAGPRVAQAVRVYERQCCSEAQEDVAHLADGVERQQPLGLLLLECLHRADKERQRPQHGNHQPPPRGQRLSRRYWNQPDERAHQTVHPGLDHHARQQCRHWRRCRRVRVRQPHLAERPHAGLDAKADQEQCQRQADSPALGQHLRNVPTHGVEVVARRPVASQEKRASHYQRAGDLHHRQITPGRTHALRLLVLVAHEQERRDRHQLPEGAEEHHHVRGRHDPIHPCHEQQEARVVAAHAVLRVVLHVANGVQRCQNGNERDQTDEDGREAVDGDAQRGPELRQRRIRHRRRSAMTQDVNGRSRG